MITWIILSLLGGVFVGLGVWKWPTAVPLTIDPQLPPDQRECPDCGTVHYVWRTYADGSISCVDCSEKH